MINLPFCSSIANGHFFPNWQHGQEIYHLVSLIHVVTSQYSLPRAQSFKCQSTVMLQEICFLSIFQYMIYGDNSQFYYYAQIESCIGRRKQIFI